MKTKFTVKIDLSAKHIRLMGDMKDNDVYDNYTREVEYLDSKGIVFADYMGDDIYCISLTKLGKNILAEIESSEWQMQPGFVVTQTHIEVLRRMLRNEYMSVSTANALGFADVMADMTGVNAPFPFLCHAGVAGGWVVMKNQDDTYPDYLAEAQNQIRKWEREHRPSVVLEFSADEEGVTFIAAGEDDD